MKEGIVISKGPHGGYVVSLNGTNIGSVAAFGDADYALERTRAFARGAAAAIFATTGAVVSIEEDAS